MNETIKQMEELAAELGFSDFDLMLVGDGSGTTADKACAFACKAYDRRQQEVITHWAALNHGTNNLAELLPYVHALWYHQTKTLGQNLSRRTLIVSDSELTVRQGLGAYTRDRTANGAFWRSIEFFEDCGYEIVWRHVRRNTNPISTACDHIAGLTRKSFV